jgi:antitoxin CptB
MLGRTGSDSRQAMIGRPSYPALGGRKRAMTEELEIGRKRLKFRSWHRGTREMDLLLGRFADQRLDALDAEAIRVYAALLEESDPDIYNWVTGREECPSGILRPLVAALAEFHSSISS